MQILVAARRGAPTTARVRCAVAISIWKYFKTPYFLAFHHFRIESWQLKGVNHLANSGNSQ